MPVRNGLDSVEYGQTYNGSVTKSILPNSIGTFKSISAFNNAGVWVPGHFRANPVVISRFSANSTPGSTAGEDKVGKQKCTASGHYCALAANNLGMLPLSPFYDSVTAWNSSVAGSSLLKVRSKLNAADLDLGMMLGELRETVGGLAQPLQALKEYVKVYNKLRRSGKRPKMSDTLNMLSGSWLEWRYGITPLISDISAIITHIMEQSRSVDGKLLRKSAKVTIPTRKFNFSVQFAPGVYAFNGEVKATVDTKYISKVYYRCLRPLSFAEEYGLTIGHVPALLWEVTPLSFVWDWFFNVGLWLQSANTSSSREVLGSVTSAKHVVEATATVGKATFLGMPSSYQGGSYHVSYEKLDRHVNQGVTIGSLLNVEALSLKRQVDALSLIWQRMPKLMR